MEPDSRFARDVINELSATLEIPEGHYQQATERYKSLGSWLERDESSLVRYEPQIFPQGSFRLGTAIKPISGNGQYDLDLVCELARLTKAEVSQKQLKDYVGDELKAYAKKYRMRVMPEEGKRCWTLEYADDVSFHMDVLPAIPEDDAPKELLATALTRSAGSTEWVDSAIAITDNTHAKYRVIDRDWPQSNPRGYAQWFETRMQAVAQTRLRSLVDSGYYASTEEVPAWAWKTPLQIAIQLLKRHRDVMFEATPKRKPISIIISTLAAKAFTDQANTFDALVAIAKEMPNLVRPTEPRVPNPVNPSEDFADKWRAEPALRLEEAFVDWRRQLLADLEQLARGMDRRSLQRFLKNKFGADLAEDRLHALAPAAVAATTPAVQLRQEPKPWGIA